MAEASAPVSVGMGELKGRFEKVRTGVTQLAKGFHELCQLCGGAGSVLEYEGNRRLEEFMHRVGDAMSILTTVSSENVAAMQDAAVRRAGLKVAE